MSFEIDNSAINYFHEDYDQRKESAVLENAVTKNGVNAASFNWHSIADNAPHFSIDLKTCLLYTSPSPRDRKPSRMPSSA